MIAEMGGIDALAFTGGIGENDAAIRAQIMAGFGFVGLSVDAGANRAGAEKLHDSRSLVAAWVIPAAEERRIAEEALTVLQAEETSMRAGGTGA